MNYSFFDNNKDGKADYKDAFSFVKNVFSSKHSDKNNYMPNSYRHPNNYSLSELSRIFELSSLS